MSNCGSLLPTVRAGYELDLQAIAAPLTDDLTFEIAPPPQADVVEAGRDGPLPPEIEPLVG
jgi:hypothetical protein